MTTTSSSTTYPFDMGYRPADALYTVAEATYHGGSRPDGWVAGSPDLPSEPPLIPSSPWVYDAAATMITEMGAVHEAWQRLCETAEEYAYYPGPLVLEDEEDASILAQRCLTESMDAYGDGLRGPVRRSGLVSAAEMDGLSDDALVEALLELPSVQSAIDVWAEAAAELIAAAARATPTQDRVRDVVEQAVGQLPARGIHGWEVAPYVDGRGTVESWAAWAPLPDGAEPGTEPGQMTLAERGIVTLAWCPWASVWCAQCAEAAGYTGWGAEDAPASVVSDDDAVEWLAGILSRWTQDQEA